MKFKCRCGHLIRDQEGSLPYKAHLTPDTKWDESHDALTSTLLGLIQAIRDGKEKEWITSYHDQELDLETSLHDIQLHNRIPYERPAYQCPECQNLHLTKQDGTLVEFQPSSPKEARNIFITAD